MGEQVDPYRQVVREHRGVDRQEQGEGEAVGERREGGRMKGELSRSPAMACAGSTQFGFRGDGWINICCSMT